MAVRTGHLTIADLLAARFQSAVRFGLDTIQQVIERDLAVHNQLSTEMVSLLADPSTDRQRLAGTSESGEMLEADEHTRVPTQKAPTGATVAFPLKNFQYAIGWTRKFMERKTPADIAAQYTMAKKAHRKKIVAEVKRAIFGPLNYTHRDHLVDNVDLGVKRLVNADSMGIPEGPNGESYDATTHTHYMANATLTAAFLTSVINTVVEHGHGGAVVVVINKTDEAAVRALVGFVPYVDPRLALGTGQVPTGERADITRLDNRAIGLFGSAEVWVKPWGIANYAFAYDTSASKPLVLRTANGATLELRVAAKLETYPLYAEYMEDEFGFGVWTRTNGAVGYFAGAEYVEPTISG